MEKVRGRVSLMGGLCCGKKGVREVVGKFVLGIGSLELLVGGGE